MDHGYAKESCSHEHCKWHDPKWDKPNKQVRKNYILRPRRVLGISISSSFFSRSLLRRHCGQMMFIVWLNVRCTECSSLRRFNEDRYLLCQCCGYHVPDKPSDGGSDL